jgi:hypothetical protein
VIRPGPLTITPGACPGGVIIHIYAATFPPSLLLTRAYGPDDDIGIGALADAITADKLTSAPVCLVGYDGDTGRRFTAQEWMAKGR